MVDCRETQIAVEVGVVLQPRLLEESSTPSTSSVVVRFSPRDRAHLARLLLSIALGSTLALSATAALAADLIPAWPPLFYDVPITGGQLQTFTIPSGFQGKLDLLVEGGDGGRAISDAGGTDIGASGPSALVRAAFDVGPGANQISQGSTLAFIIGRQGESHVNTPPSVDTGGDGGAGTAVLVQLAGGSSWQLLVGAGGGGGGEAGNSQSAGGKYGRFVGDGEGSTLHGSDGGGFSPGSGGTFIQGFGSFGGEGDGDQGGGGGTGSDATGSNPGRRAAGGPLYPTEGPFVSQGGGSTDPNHTFGDGWGGGGGGADMGSAGAGGGGLSGGGAGGFLGGGGGGGSAYSTGFGASDAAIVFRAFQSEARIPQDGAARYSLQPNYTISPRVIWTPGTPGGSQTVQIDLAAGLGTEAWTAVSNDPTWLHVIGSASGTGAGSVQIAFDAYAGFNQRIGTVVIAGQTFQVGQLGTPLVTNATDAADLIGEPLPGALRRAIRDNESTTGATIYFDPSLSGQTIVLDRSLTLNSPFTIDASSLPDGVTLDGSGGLSSHRIMTISNDSDVTLLGLNLVGGNASTGGAIALFSGNLVVIDSTFSGNSADFGGAIHNSGTQVLAVDSTFANNVATFEGGAIWNPGNPLSLGVFHSTIVGNSSGVGGGIYNGPASPAFVSQSIVAGNTATSSAPDIFGPISGLHTLIGNPTGAIGLGVDLVDYQTGDPRIAPFGDWGGPTWTMPPLPGSPVVGATTAGFFTQSKDQRGTSRPPGASPIEIGSVELFGFPQPPQIDTDSDMIDDRLELPSLYPQFTLGVDDSDLDSDADTVPDWEELANATDPDDPDDFPVPEPGFLAQLVVGSAFMLGLLRRRGRGDPRLRKSTSPSSQ